MLENCHKDGTFIRLLTVCAIPKLSYRLYEHIRLLRIYAELKSFKTLIQMAIYKIIKNMC